MSAAPARVEYAVYAVFELARAFRSKKPISAQKIATKYQISEKFVSLILQDLKKSRLVSAVRGPLGGFRLIPAPEELTLGYVVALAEKSNGDSGKNAANENRDEDAAAETSSLKKAAKTKKNATDSKKLDAEAVASRTAFESAWREAEAKRQEFLNEILFSDLIKDSRPNIPPLNFSI